MTPPAQITALTAILLLVALCLLTGCARADSVMLGGVSTHLFSADENYNQNHKLIAVQVGNAMAARFINSHNHESYAVAYGHKWPVGDFRADLYAGAVTGYRGCYNDDGAENTVCPLLVPSVSYTGWGTIQPTLLLMGEALVATIRIEW